MSANDKTTVLFDCKEDVEYMGCGCINLTGKSPNGHIWRIKITNEGVITTTDLSV